MPDPTIKEIFVKNGIEITQAIFYNNTIKGREAH